MIEKRRYFHENPELTGKELKTIEYLKDASLKGGRKMTYKQYLEKVANYKLLTKHYGE